MPGENRAIRVACALMEKEGRLLATKRGIGGPHGGLWELPGGKIENGETPEMCIRRELHEELGIEVEPLACWSPVRTVLPGLTIRLYPVVCRWAKGRIRLREHESWGWFSAEELPALEWSPADRPLIARWIKHSRGERA